MAIEIVVLGGGSAGWLTASIIAAEHRESGNVNVHLVESPDVPTIGVGEGTWPTMRESLRRIGLSESEFIRYCSASFKQGSTFVGWQSGDPSDVYHHPFTAPFNESCESAYSVWRATNSDTNYSVAVSAQPAICNLNKAPKQASTPEFAGVLNYGYHLDAGKFGGLLQKHGVKQLGIKHTLDHVVSVDSDENGYIVSLVTRSSGSISGDLFIDCSGSKGLLIEDHFGVPFVDLSDVSINDTALAIQVPYQDKSYEIKSSTIATAHEAGWTWDIGLSSRRGVGYVFSSQFTDEERAWETLRDYIAKTTDKETITQLSPRKIKINPGHRKVFWIKNCVAVGMAAGFIEPLEASALALIELSANMIRDQLPINKSTMTAVAERFNEIFSYRWQRIRDFLKLHYVISKRRDTEYWREVTRWESSPASLRQQLEIWRTREPNKYDFLQIEELFPAISYQYVLYGMGFSTENHLTRTRIRAYEDARCIMQRLQADIQLYTQHLPTNRELLNHIARYDMAKI
jgi:flavin-dependent dehydrogenase